MDMTNREYGAYVKAKAGRSPLWKDLILAFLVGGLICAGGQGLRQFYMSRGMDGGRRRRRGIHYLDLFLAALLTGLGTFDKLAKWAGAGTLVPITGFANA